MIYEGKCLWGGMRKFFASLQRVLRTRKTTEGSSGTGFILKNDALMEVLYEQISDGFPVDFEYAVFVFHGVYDIPVKAKDKEWLEGSEEIYDFAICTASPMKAEYEPDKPVFGFLYPAFSDRSSDENRIDIFNMNPDNTAEGLMYKLTGIR